MRYGIEDIKERVRVILDQNRVNGDMLSEFDMDTLALDEIIRDRMGEAVRIVEMAAPTYLLDGGKTLRAKGQLHEDGCDVTWESGEEGKGMCYLVLPDDFMRLVSFEMSDWERPVNTAISDRDAAYAKQRSRWAGVRGCPQKPVVALVRKDGETLQLEAYSSTGGKGVRVRNATYLPWPAVDETGIEICPKLLDAAAYQMAVIVARMVGEASLAESCAAMVNELIK